MKTINFVVFLTAGVLLAAAGMAPAEAEVWRLDPESGWVSTAELSGAMDVPAYQPVRDALAGVGQAEDVVKALEALKRNHPELAGGDLDAFLAAERVYAKRNLGKAGKLYKDFLDKWPDSIYQPAAMERYFSIGAAFLQGHKRVFLGFLRLPAFDEGVNIMRVITDRTGNSPIALRALQVTAENQERRKKYIDAYHTWAEISVRWPTGVEGRNALLRMGRALHASYDGPDYDITVLHSAQSYFEDFILRYPEIAEELNLSETLKLITEQVAYKHYEVGFYYEQTGNKGTADKHYQEVIERWPNTSAAQMAVLRLAPEASPAVETTASRSLFNAGNEFLDSWFGAKWFFSDSKEVVEQ